MTKNKKQRTENYWTIKFLVMTVVLFVISSLIPLPGKLAFKCDEQVLYKPNRVFMTHREEHGLPLPVAKRAVSEFDCAPTDGKDYGQEHYLTTSIYLLNPDRAHEQYQQGYIILINIVIDLVFWLFVAYLILSLIKKGKSNE
jgi:hypothetical protein